MFQRRQNCRSVFLDMELLKWQTVLTEWINCLDIFTPIRSLDELRNDELLKKLLLKLIQNKLDSERSSSNICIIDFFKTYYPHYQLKVESTLSQDATEITYACSLLLHYCCMIDSKAEFINKLCKNLTYFSQVNIRHFLEQLESHEEITRDNLKATLLATHKYLSTPSKSTSPFNSPKHVKDSNSSFLQDFLRTPVKKYQQCVEQHKKEIKTLLDQLDIERLEKADLQEELKAQYERIKSLESKMSVKTKDISRLRADLLALENQRSASDNKVETHTQNKRLRNEIDSLEKYVGILHQEQDELRAERDTARDKLNRFEEQCKEWQDKAFEAEHKCSNLSVEIERQQNELVCLQEHSEELNRMLVELKPRRIDESYEMDSSHSDITSQNRSGIIDCESLAHTVVDLQLIDAQEENEILNKQLIDFKELISKQESQFEDVEKKFQSGQHALKESLERNIELTKTNEYSKAEIKNMATKLSQSELNLTETQTENEKLYNELKAALGKCTNFVAELNDLNQKYKNLLLDKDTIQTKLNESLKQIQKYSHKNEVSKNTLNKFNHDLQNCLTKLETLIENNSEVSAKDNFDKFNILVKQLELKNFEEAKNKDLLRDNCENLKRQVVDLQNEILVANESESRLKTEISKLNNSFEESLNKIKILENSLASYTTLIDEQKVMLADKCQTIDKQNTNILQKENNLKMSDAKVCELNKLIEQLEQQLLNEQKSKEKVEKSCTVMKAKYDTEISYLNNKIQEKNIHAEELQKLIDGTCQTICNVLYSNKVQEKNLKNNLTTSVLSLKELLNNTITEKKVLSKESEVLNKELRVCGEFLENHKEEIVNNMIESNKNLAKYFNKMEQIGDTFENVTNTSNIGNKQLLQVTIYMVNLSNKFKILTSNIENVIQDKKLTNKEIEGLNEDISTLKTKKTIVNDKYNQLVHESSSRIEQLSELSQKLQSENNSLTKNLENYQNKYYKLKELFSKVEIDLAGLSKKYELDVEKYLQTIEQLQQEKADIKNKLVVSKTQGNSLKSELDESINKYKIDIETLQKKYQLDIEKYLHNVEQLQQEKAELNNNLAISKTQENSLRFDLNSLQSKYEETSKNLVKSLETQKLKDDSELLIINLKKTQKDEINSLQNSFNKIRSDLEESISKHVIDIETLQKTLEQLQTENQQLMKDLKESQHHEIEMKNKLVSLENKLLDTMTNLTHSIESQEQIKRENELSVSKLIKSFTETQDNLKENIAKYQNEIEIYQHTTKETKDSNNELEKNFRDTQMNLENLTKKYQSDVENYEDTTKVLKDQNVELEKCLKESESREEQLKAELRILNCKLEDTNTNFTVILQEKDSFKQKSEIDIVNLTKSLNESLKSVETLQKLHGEQVPKIEQLTNELEIQKQSNKQLKKTIIEINSENVNIRNQLENSIKILISEREELKVNIEDLIKDLTGSKGQYKELAEKLNITNQAQTDLSTKISKLESDLNESIIQNSSLNKKLIITGKHTEFLQNELDENKKIFHLTYENIATMLEKEIKLTAENVINKSTDANIDVDNKYDSSNTIKQQMDHLKKNIIDLLNERNKVYKHEKNELNKKIVELESKKMQKTKQFETKMVKTLETKSKEIEVLERDLSKTNNIIEEQLKEISILKRNLDEATGNMVSLETVRCNLTKSLKDVQLQLSDLMHKRNELIQVHINMVQETEQRIAGIQEGILNTNADYVNKLQIIEKAKEHEIEQKKQLENLLTAERNKTSTLQNNLHKLLLDKKHITDICSQLYNYIHELYRTTGTNQGNKFEIGLSNRTDESDSILEHLFEEKEIVDKEYSLVSNEIIKIKTDMLNYEHLKLDYIALKNKCEILSVCENENNCLKNIKCEMEHKLSDLQQENSKYQKTITEKELQVQNILKEHNSIYKRYEEGILLLKTNCTKWEEQLQELEINHKETLHKLNSEELKQKEKECELLQQTNVQMESKLETLEHKLKAYESLLIENQFEYQNLKKRHNELSDKNTDLNNQISSLEQKSLQLQKIISELETEYQNLTKRNDDLSEKYKFLVDKCSAESDTSGKQENAKLRAAYTNLMAENSRFQLDCTILRKTIEERNAQLSELSLMKESYEKLLEDNNKVCTELDTIRYKRTRDKEEFKRMLEEKNKSGPNVDNQIQIQSVRQEYEEKLKKMKEKIVQLYKEEVDKERRKIAAEQQQYAQALETIASLKSQLWITSNKYADLKKDYEKLAQAQMQTKNQQNQTMCLRRDDVYSSRESVSSLKERRVIRDVEERRLATLPRDAKLASKLPMDMIEETVTISRRRSITAAQNNLDPGLKMEDEAGEIFNNTYLADLKSGRCIPHSSHTDNRESIYRLSELQHRNSLCPPHLKSSYPAETQYASPTKFKEDDIKTGNVDLDDSMSSSLLPSEKPRTKKDWGQTLYKKPGPPTPSKNGGRLSLQGNEVHPRDILREHNDNARANTSRATSTPNRIKALFMSKTTTQRNDSENQSTPTRGKRRSIFRLAR